MLPEWAPQDAILLAWPHSKTDWAPMLTEVQRTYCDIIDQITRFEPALPMTPGVVIMVLYLYKAPMGSEGSWTLPLTLGAESLSLL